MQRLAVDPAVEPLPAALPPRTASEQRDDQRRDAGDRRRPCQRLAVDRASAAGSGCRTGRTCARRSRQDRERGAEPPASRATRPTPLARAVEPGHPAGDVAAGSTRRRPGRHEQQDAAAEADGRASPLDASEPWPESKPGRSRRPAALRNAARIDARPSADRQPKKSLPQLGPPKRSRWRARSRAAHRFPGGRPARRGPRALPAPPPADQAALAGGIAAARPGPEVVAGGVLVASVTSRLALCSDRRDASGRRSRARVPRPGAVRVRSRALEALEHVCFPSLLRRSGTSFPSGGAPLAGKLTVAERLAGVATAA